MTRRGLVLLAATAGLVLAVAAPATAQQPRDSLGVRVLGATPDGYLHVDLGHGARVTRQVAFSSTFTHPVTLDVFSDASFVGVSPRVLTLGASDGAVQAEAAVTVTVRAPRGLGAYRGTVWARVRPVAFVGPVPGIRTTDAVGMRVLVTVVAPRPFPWWLAVVALLVLVAFVAWRGRGRRAELAGTGRDGARARRRGAAARGAGRRVAEPRVPAGVGRRG